MQEDIGGGRNVEAGMGNRYSIKGNTELLLR